MGKEVNTEKLEQKSLVKNKWLAGKEEFRETVLAFYEACTEAASMSSVLLPFPWNYRRISLRQAITSKITPCGCFTIHPFSKLPNRGKFVPGSIRTTAA